MNRLALPAAPAAPVPAEPGVAVQARLRSPVLAAITRLGRAAARRFHQLPGPRAAA